MHDIIYVTVEAPCINTSRGLLLLNMLYIILYTIRRHHIKNSLISHGKRFDLKEEHSWKIAFISNVFSMLYMNANGNYWLTLQTHINDLFPMRYDIFLC